jgi:hypothetical protein
MAANESFQPSLRKPKGFDFPDMSKAARVCYGQPEKTAKIQMMPSRRRTASSASNRKKTPLIR